MANAARFKIGDRIYSTSSIDKVSLKDLLLFQADLKELGFTDSWSDIESAAQQMASNPEGAESHPLALLLFATTIWASRRAAGEDIRFIDAIDVEMSELTILPATQDKAPGKAKGSKSTPAMDSAPDASAVV
jgi:hypothetical protein